MEEGVGLSSASTRRERVLPRLAVQQRHAGLPGHGFPCKLVSDNYKPSQFIRFETHEFSPSRFLQPVIPQRTSDRCLSHQGYNRVDGEVVARPLTGRHLL